VKGPGDTGWGLVRGGERVWGGGWGWGEVPGLLGGWWGWGHRAGGCMGVVFVLVEVLLCFRSRESLTRG